MQTTKVVDIDPTPIVDQVIGIINGLEDGVVVHSHELKRHLGISDVRWYKLVMKPELACYRATLPNKKVVFGKKLDIELLCGGKADA